MSVAEPHKPPPLLRSEASIRKSNMEDQLHNNRGGQITCTTFELRNGELIATTKTMPREEHTGLI